MRLRRTGANGLAAPSAPAAETSDRGGAQKLTPMRNPLLERALAPVSEFIEVDLLEDPEGEAFCAMKVPGGLKRLVRLDALLSANVRRVQIVERSGAVPTHCSSVAAQRRAYTPATALRSL